jgi:hypothetical protein
MTENKKTFEQTFTEREWQSKPLQRLAARMPLLGLCNARCATLPPNAGVLSCGGDNTAGNERMETGGQND